MSFKARYSTSKNLEENGVWVDFGDGVRVCVRRINSKVSKEVRRKLEKTYASAFKGRDLPAELVETIMIKQLSQALVVDWEGVDPTDSGKVLPCTPENVEKVMTEFPDFREDVLTACIERATFQAEEIADAKGN
jgi:hypothetical protein